MYASSLETAERGGGAQESPGPVKQPACAQSHRHGQVAGHLRLSGALNLLLEYPRGLTGALRRGVDYIVDVFFSPVYEFDMQGFTPSPTPNPRQTYSFKQCPDIACETAFTFSCSLSLLPCISLTYPPSSPSAPPLVSRFFFSFL